ncbi:hypothetical protein MYSI104531_24570 [Mycobacterium simiae]
MVGQHQPVPVFGGPDQCHPERRRLGQVAHRRAFGGAEQPEVLVGLCAVDAVQFQVLPSQYRTSGDRLHRFVELRAESGGQVGVAVDHGVDGPAQAGGVQCTGDADVQLDRIQLAVAIGVGVEEESLLQRRQRQDIGDPVPPAQLVDLLLGEPGRGDVRGGQAAATAIDVGADAGESLEPQLAQPAHPFGVEGRRRPCPVGVQLRADFGVHGAGIEFYGVPQRHWDCRGRRGQRQAVRADAPQLVGMLAGASAEPSEIVESDHRFGPGQVDVGIEVAQQAIGQDIGQGTQPLLGVLERHPQRGITGAHLLPGQSADRQCHRVFGGEPADGAGQVDVVGQMVVAAVAFHLDADGHGAGGQELGAGQPECDQQNVLHSGVKRGRDLTQ